MFSCNKLCVTLIDLVIFSPAASLPLYRQVTTPYIRKVSSATELSLSSVAGSIQSAGERERERDPSGAAACLRRTPTI